MSVNYVFKKNKNLKVRLRNQNKENYRQKEKINILYVQETK